MLRFEQFICRAARPGVDHMLEWFRNVWMSVITVLQGMYVTLLTMMKTYNRRTFTEVYEYPEVPLKVKPRYRGFHRFDLTTCIGCDKCAVACPVDCIYIDKEKSPVGKGFRINGYTIDYTKCMFCALCVDPCPVDCIFMGSIHDLSCYSRDGCIVDYAKLPLEIAWGKASLNPTVVSESKVLHEAVWVKGEPSPFEFAGAEK
ncbi:MAG TPA: NADH-quinone oxidoreductase subunit I [Planctomycetaceae bacterium]|nr:NADH-quinone oxidoreductase subunit I [Planctomycetaceae bacterium]